MLRFSFIGVFILKAWLEFSLTSFGTLKYDCVIKKIEMFNFLPLINNSITTGFRLLSLIISTIISSKTINILCFLPIWYSSIILYYFIIMLLISCISFECSVKTLESLKCFNPVLSLLLIKNWYFFHMDLLHINIFDQYLADYFLNLIMHLFFQIQNLQLLIFSMDDL